MSARTSSVISWTSFVLSLLAVGGSTAIDLAASDFDPVGLYSGLAVLSFSFVGALIASRKPDNPIGWIFVAVGVSLSLSSLTQTWADDAINRRPGVLPLGPVMAWLSTWVWNPGILLLFTFLLLLFPDGHLPSKRWRIVAWLSVVALVAMVVPVAVTAWSVPAALLIQTGEDAPAAAPDAFKVAFNVQIAGVLLMFVLGIASAVSLILRFRRAQGDERQQLKWFAFAAAIVVGTVILASPLFRLPEVIQLLAFPLIPAASAVAIFKYRLYDLDIVIRKTLVFGVIAAFITVVYMALVVGPVLLVGDRGDNTALVLSALAAGVVAVAFQPIRQRAQRLANRVVYGKRATPYEVLSDLSERVGDAFATEDMLPRMVKALAEGTGAVRAEAWLKTGRQMHLAAAWPEADDLPREAEIDGDDVATLRPEAGIAAPVRHQGTVLGALTVRKTPAEPPSPAEEKLVADLAAQAGLVLRNAALIADLRASRQRLVTAQDEERRRIERNLHDGAQQQLVALAVKQRLAEGLIERDPEQARSMLAQIREETQEALETLRELARGIYPPLLADQGLAAALEAQARKAALPVRIEAHVGRRYPQETEAAVYFCCLEALQNVAKYAKASSAIVHLVDGEDGLVFEVTDDGTGFDLERTTPGTGLQGMADRLEALGGTLEVISSSGRGTTVRGRLP
jgi:signal transduction histidine kinase